MEEATILRIDHLSIPPDATTEDFFPMKTGKVFRTLMLDHATHFLSEVSSPSVPIPVRDRKGGADPLEG